MTNGYEMSIAWLDEMAWKCTEPSPDPADYGYNCSDETAEQLRTLCRKVGISMGSAINMLRQLEAIADPHTWSSPWKADFEAKLVEAVEIECGRRTVRQSARGLPDCAAGLGGLVARQRGKGLAQQSLLSLPAGGPILS